MTFRTPDEAVALANNTRYGLAASVWSENINLALDIAPQIKAGVVWINCTNLFDAAAGFGGYRESGFGREGGREGLCEYLSRAAEATAAASDGSGAANADAGSAGARRRRRDGAARHRPHAEALHRRQAGAARLRLQLRSARRRRRARSARSGDGNRKDIRNAVEAARAAAGWAQATGAQPRADPLLHRREPRGARRRVRRRGSRD